MKKFKSIFAVLIAIITVFALGVTSFADTPSTGSLTVTGNGLTGKTVDAYRIFTASWVDSNETGTNDDIMDSSDTLSYVLDSAWNNYFSAVPSIAADTSSKSLSEKASAYVAGLSDAQVLALAKDLKAYAETNNISPTYTSQPAVNNQAVISSMTPGYYMVIPESGSTSTSRETDATLVNVPSNESASWAIKSVYPTVEKTIAIGQKESTASIGDTIDFGLTSAVPDMTEYTAYEFKMIDTMGTGLTFDDDTDIIVTIGSETLEEDTDYTVTFDSANNRFTVDFGDLKDLVDNNANISEGDTITVTYSAILNGSAVIAGAGNPNSVVIEYSNDPSDSTSTETSAPSETATYTYAIQINKHDNSATPVQLPNAVFSLKDASDNVIPLIATGTTNVYRIATPEEIAEANNNQTVQTIQTDSTGILTINGLDAGTYHLEEVTAPSGYNKLGADIVIVIAPKVTGTAPNTTTLYNVPTYSVDGATATESNVINVVNTKGSLLPTTGGIGTIGLTILGVAAVVAGIILITRKKKSPVEK